MKRKICMMIGAVMLVSAGCGNRNIIDMTYHYNEAIIKLPDDTVIRGEVENWRDYQDGDQIQVRIDGKTYLVHSSDVVLISGKGIEDNGGAVE